MVLVLASPEAEDICQTANGLTVVDLLRPLGVFKKLNFNNGGAFYSSCLCHQARLRRAAMLRAIYILCMVEDEPSVILQSQYGALETHPTASGSSACASTTPTPSSSHCQRQAHCHSLYQEESLVGSTPPRHYNAESMRRAPAVCWILM